MWNLTINFSNINHSFEGRGIVYFREMANDSSIYFLYIKNEKEGLNYILSRPDFCSFFPTSRISPASVKFKHSKIRFSLLSVTLEDTPYKSSPSPSNFLPDESININQHDKSARVIHSVRNVSRLSCFSTARTTPCATSYAFFNRIRVPFLLRRSCWSHHGIRWRKHLAKKKK